MNLTDLDLQGQHALIRVDFNVPLNEAREVTDDTRIRAALPTIQYVLQQGGSAVLMSHLGRPKGRDEEFSLKHILPRLEALLGRSVKFASDCVEDAALDVTQSLKPGEVALLENLRFHPEEKGGDEFFAGQLAENGDFEMKGDSPFGLVKVGSRKVVTKKKVKEKTEDGAAEATETSDS